MLLVGLTGGIGSGKSTVAELFARRGAVILDADAFARDAVAAGSAGFAEVVRRFGPGVVGPDGELDRPQLASIVFADEDARRDLEAIVHPVVRSAIADAITAHADSNRILVLVNPLLIEMGTHRDCDVVIVTAVDPETQVARSVARGMDEADVRARMAAQLPLEERISHANVVLDNDGTLDELDERVSGLWDGLVACAQG